MGFASESGYTPQTVEAILDNIRENINSIFLTDYTAESFVGTNWYKFSYALAQRIQRNEIKTAEIFATLQLYFRQTNEVISRPVATSPGIVEALSNAGYVASVKPMVVGDAGKTSVCVLVDDGGHATGTVTITSYANLVSGTHDTVTVGATVFTAQATSVTPGGATFQAATSNAATAASLAAQINAHAVASLLVKATVIGAVVTIRAIHGGTAGNAIVLGYTDNDTNVGATKSGTLLSGGTASSTYAAEKLAIATVLKNSIAAGIVSQGTETQTIVLSNGQSFDWAYYLPNYIPVLLKLTTTLSENNQVVISTPEETKALLLANIQAKYKLGKNFEPQTYFTIADAPWCSQVLLQWSSDNGSTWNSTIYDANFDDLFDFDLSDITLVEV